MMFLAATRKEDGSGHFKSNKSEESPRHSELRVSVTRVRANGEFDRKEARDAGGQG